MSYQIKYKPTKRVNFKDSDEIIKNFNSSLIQLSTFYKYNYILELEEEAIRNLRYASQDLFTSAEWSFKNFLFYKLEELYKSNKIKRKKYIDLNKYIHSNKFRMNGASKEIYNFISTELNNLNIDLKVIVEAAELAYNSPKHEATIPEFEKYYEALPHVRNFIINFIKSTLEVIEIPESPFQMQENQEFLNFYESYFGNDYTKVLIVDSNDSYQQYYEEIVKIQWDIVIDFNENTDKNGLYYQYSKTFNYNPEIKILGINNKIIKSNMPIWLMANGLVDREKSYSMYPEWLSTYGNKTSEFLNNLFKEYARPVNLFLMVKDGKDMRKIKRIIDDFDSIYRVDGESLFKLMLAKDLITENLNDDYAYLIKEISYTLKEFVDKISKINFSHLLAKSDSRLIKVDNGKENGFVEIDNTLFIELSDYGEVVFKNIHAPNFSPNQKNFIEFLQGEDVISWESLAHSKAIIRENYREILQSVNQGYYKIPKSILEIEYEPGVGGTTLLRQIAWDNHLLRPTYILRDYVEGITNKLLTQLYLLTTTPLLILIDSNNLNYSTVKQIKNSLKIGQTYNFLIVYIKRKHGGEKSTYNDLLGKLNKLNKDECLKMENILTPYITDSNIVSKLKEISLSISSTEKTPFIYSLYAFKEDFKGVKQYINNFVKEMDDNSIETKVLMYISIFDYFCDGKPVNSDFFIGMFRGMGEIRDLFDNNNIINTLVRREHIDKLTQFKIKHASFSEELLIQITSSNISDEINIEKLVDFVESLINDSRKNSKISTKISLELLKSLLVERQVDYETNRPKFSNLIEYIKKHTSTSKFKYLIGKIFKKLVEVYPDEPHFLAHLARYHFMIDADFENGFKNIEKALSIEGFENDHVLLHMKAMGHHYYIKNILENSSENILPADKYKVIIENLELALQIFENIRTHPKSKTDSTVYIAEIVLCVDTIDGLTIKNVITPNKRAELYERAIYLYDECKNIISTEDKTGLDIQRDKLFVALGDIDTAIQNLEKSILDNDNPVLKRFLVNVYLEKMKEGNIDYYKKIAELMEFNMNKESNNPYNIILWLNAIRNIKHDKPREILNEAIYQVEKWVELTNSLESHYYNFILNFIKVVEGSSLSIHHLKDLERKLIEKSYTIPEPTRTKEWLGKGNGIERLLSNRDFIESSYNEDSLELLQGNLGKITSSSKGAVKIFELSAYFNPSIAATVSEKQENQRVEFGIGFSYEGLRVFNNSLKPYTGSKSEKKGSELKVESKVIGEIIAIKEHYILLNIPGSELMGSISIKELLRNNLYSDSWKIGGLIEGYIFDKREIFEEKAEVWFIELNQKNKSKVKPGNFLLQDKLKDFKIK